MLPRKIKIVLIMLVSFLSGLSIGPGLSDRSVIMYCSLGLIGLAFIAVDLGARMVGERRAREVYQSINRWLEKPTKAIPWVSLDILIEEIDRFRRKGYTEVLADIDIGDLRRRMQDEKS